MDLVRVDTQRAYQWIREQITTLRLAPGAPINEQQLAEEMSMGTVPVREALKLLAHEGLVVITPRHGLYVADVDLPALEQISELRLALESLSARLAAQRATSDDLVVLESLRHEQEAAGRLAAAKQQVTTEQWGADQQRRLFDVDHRFHQAIASAAHNAYLAATLERFFGLSQRLWYIAGPHLDSLLAAVEKHVELVKAIGEGDADRAEAIMRSHVEEFYNQVHQVLARER